MQIYDTIKEDGQHYARIGRFWAWGDTRDQCLERLAHTIAKFDNEFKALLEQIKALFNKTMPKDFEKALDDNFWDLL